MTMSGDPSILDPAVRAALDALGTPYETLACDPQFADTAAFCAQYGIAAAESCNAIVVALKTTPRRHVACLVRSDTRLDVNHKLSALVGIRRMSFATSEETALLTGMMIGGVTVAGLPAAIPLLIDTRVMEQPTVVIGGGNRSSKVRLNPHALEKLPNATVVDIALPRHPEER